MPRQYEDRLNDMILKQLKEIFSDKLRERAQSCATLHTYQGTPTRSRGHHYFGCSDVHIGSLSTDDHDHQPTVIICPSSMYYDTRNYTMPRIRGCFQLFNYDGHRLFHKIWKVKQRRNKNLVLPCTKEVTK